MDFTPEFWTTLYRYAGGGILGGIVTALGLVAVAKTKSKTESRKNDQEFHVNMDAQQQRWFSSLESQLNEQMKRTDALQLSQQTQRDYYENVIATVRTEYIAKLEQQEAFYIKKLSDQEDHCQEQIGQINKRAETLEAQVMTLITQRKKLFQQLEGGAGCLSEKPLEK